MRLTLFFTHNTSIKNWDRVGMLEREVALYRNYIEKGVKVTFITYGRKDHSLYAERLKGIDIRCNEHRLPPAIYARLIPLLHAQALRRTDIIKSNQTPGALAALAAARLHKKPLVARCGYMHSEFIANEHGASAPITLRAIADEQKLFAAADAIEVTTPMMKESILHRIPGSEKRISVVPNYVDTEMFAPKETGKAIDVLFIGRLSPQKNLFSLLDALQGLDMRTTIIGKGNQELELKEHAEKLKLSIDWKGNVPNTELPAYLNKTKLFILPSHYEGHPKTLIEAMACGCAAIGADSPGIREVLTHLKNGWVCGTDGPSIREAVSELAASQDLRNALGENARRFALANYSLERIAEQELAILNRVLTNR